MLPVLFFLWGAPAVAVDGLAETIAAEAWQVSFQNVTNRELLTEGASWSAIKVPGTLRLRESTPVRVRYIWLRSRFAIAGDPGRFYGISLGRIYHSDAVFINGRLVGEKSTKDFFELHYPRNYIINPGVLMKGNNELLIRVGVFSDQFGGLTDTARIMAKENFEKQLSRDNFLFLLTPFGFLFLYTGLAVLLFLFFYFNRVEKKLIYSFTGLFFYIILTLIIFFPYQSPVISLPLEVQLSVQITALKVLIPLFILVLILIVRSQYRVRLGRSNIATISMVIFILALTIINSAVLFNPWRSVISYILLALVVVTGISYLTYMTWRLGILQPDRDRTRFTAAMLLMADITIIVEAVSYMSGGTLYGIFAVFSSPVIIVLFMIVFIKDYINGKVAMAMLYETLKKPGRAVSESDEDRLPITESSEEKLKRVIAFIEENYTSDISREGLAAAVDLNPSYMGRIFMAYTGKKINDYINELRVKKVIEKIEKSDTLILDSALDAGFESISTFNRAFKKVTGVTPSEYKKTR